MRLHFLTTFENSGTRLPSHGSKSLQISWAGASWSPPWLPESYVVFVGCFTEHPDHGQSPFPGCDPNARRIYDPKTRFPDASNAYKLICSWLVHALLRLKTFPPYSINGRSTLQKHLETGPKLHCSLKLSKNGQDFRDKRIFWRYPCSLKMEVQIYETRKTWWFWNQLIEWWRF